MQAADLYVKAIAGMMQSPETKVRAIIKQLTVDDRELRERMHRDVSEEEAAALLAALRRDRERVLAGFIAGSIPPVRQD
jgi:hypothetical protein